MSKDIQGPELPDSKRRPAPQVPSTKSAGGPLAKLEDPAAETAFMNPGRLAVKGAIVTIVFVGGAFAWAAFAQLESAISAQGVIVVESRRKAVQHYEGGIVKEVLVQEGRTVAAGEPLLLLEDTQAKTGVDVIRDQVDALSAQEARLISERDGATQLVFPQEILARATSPKIAQMLAGEQNKFATRRSSLEKQIDILAQRNLENGRQIAGLVNQQNAVEQQNILIAEETTGVDALYQQGLSTLPRVLALRRQSADLTGRYGELLERIAQIKLNSEENKLQMTSLRNQHLSEVADELREAQTKKIDLVNRLTPATDVAQRTMIPAPVAGKVVNLAIHTKGAVIRSGDTVMEIVPAEDSLDIEARVEPQDADTVQPGMIAHVSFSSLKQRRLPQLEGVVRTISADRLTDQRSGMPYFNVIVSVERKVLDKYKEMKLMPGLPVDVSIAVGKRTMFDYILAPIYNVLQKGMREP